MNNPYAANSCPLVMTLPIDLKSIELVLWIRPFSTDTMKTNYRISYPSASLYLQRKVDPFARKVMSQDQRAALSFQITQFNLAEVQERFETALNWFTPENLDQLYGTSDDGIMMFNSDYASLNTTFVDSYMNTQSAIKIVPTVVEVGQGVMEPGVIFYVNRTENAETLRLYEFKRLANAVIKFNFEVYMNFAFQCFRHCRETGQVVSYEEVMNRMRNARRYDSNMI